MKMTKNAEVWIRKILRKLESLECLNEEFEMPTPEDTVRRICEENAWTRLAKGVWYWTRIRPGEETDLVTVCLMTAINGKYPQEDISCLVYGLLDWNDQIGKRAYHQQWRGGENTWADTLNPNEPSDFLDPLPDNVKRAVCYKEGRVQYRPFLVYLPLQRSLKQTWE